MAALHDFGCGNCGVELDLHPKKRHVPGRGGRLLPVCDHCAQVIDRQGRIDGLDDDGLVRAARGYAAVDRAVRAHAEAVSLFAGPQTLPPLPVALQLGWRLCVRCGRPVKPSWAVTIGGDVFHPVCIAFRLGERVAASLSGTSAGRTPGDGDARPRIAARHRPADASKAA